MTYTVDPKHPADEWTEIIDPDEVEILEGPDA